jgi:hypothetical protein
MRPVDAPAKAVTRRGGEDLVFLGVIEVIYRQPWLFLPERRRRENAFSIGLEWPEIVFEAGDQPDMSHGTRRRDGVEEVAHHGGVDADVLNLGRLAHPGGNEEVAGSCPVEHNSQ